MSEQEAAFAEFQRGRRNVQTGTQQRDPTSYASALRRSVGPNRFEQAQREEEEDMRRAIEASLASTNDTQAEPVPSAGTSMSASVMNVQTSEADQRNSVAVDQKDQEIRDTKRPNDAQGEGFVGGLISSVFEVSPDFLAPTRIAVLNAFIIDSLA